MPAAASRPGAGSSAAAAIAEHKEGSGEGKGGGDHEQGKGHQPEAQSEHRPITLAGFQFRQQVDHGSTADREHRPHLLNPPPQPAAPTEGGCGAHQGQGARHRRAGRGIKLID